MQNVFQDLLLLAETAHVGRANHRGGLKVNAIGENRGDRLDRVRDALRSAGMPTDVIGRFPHENSGGQRQRIAIARAIAL